MKTMKKGNKQNALLNKEWGYHVRGTKKSTAGKRRIVDKEIIDKELKAV